MKKKITLKTANVLTGMLCLLVFANSANAQIKYTDIVPDKTISGNGFYELDINNDGTKDFKVSIVSLIGSIASVIANNNSQALVTSNTSDAFPAALSANAPIDASQIIWDNHGNLDMILNGLGQGNWKGVTDKYLGIRVDVAGQKYYGWIRMDITSAAVISIKDFAYQQTAGQGILAGNQGASNVGEYTFFDNLYIYTHHKTLFVDFSVIHDIKDVKIKVFTITGQEVKSLNVDNIKMEINMEDMCAGVYLVSISRGESIITRKISIE